MRKLLLISFVLFSLVGNTAWAGMTLSDLTVDFKHLNRDKILSDWEWLIGSNKKPILITATGDAFIQNIKNGNIEFLDVAYGNVTKVAETTDEFKTQLSNKDFVVNHFFIQLIGDLKHQKILLKKGQVYSFRHPIFLGGENALENIEVTDISVHFSSNGQIYRQVKDLPSGTKVDSVSIEK